MNRIANAKKNIIYGYTGTFINLIFKFIARTAFIYTIGITYLGVNGLYTNILSILSFAELGIGTAMNFSLYKPVVDNDRNKIKSLMYMYKKFYRNIALVIFIVGILLVPLLPFIINDPELSNKQLTIYYLFFLYNTVISYFVSYKYSLVNAEQKNYIQTNIQTITTIVTSILQILILFVFRSFLLYLLIASLILTIQLFISNKYLNKHYPILIEKEIEELSSEEKKKIESDVKSLMFHKIGDISIYQTDNILISRFINIAMVGLMANYTLLINSVHSLINIIFQSVISGIGNLIATESKEKQMNVFNVYSFLGIWFFGFASIAFIILLNPFIELWIGKKMVVGNLIVYLLIIDYYLKGQRIVISNFKNAAGEFSADKFLAIFQAIVNIVLSIFLGQFLGIAGIYLGTILQGLIANIVKPLIVFSRVFDKSAKGYFFNQFIYLLIWVVILCFLESIKAHILVEVTLLNFILMMVIVAIIPNIIFLIIFKKIKK